MRVVFVKSSEEAGSESPRDVFLERVKRVRDSLAAGFGALTPDLLDNPDLLPLALKDGPALLTGEPGVGKTQLASALHAVSPRAEHPFVLLNCAGLSSEVARAQLFGHTKGAFTGADKDSPGIFFLAAQGTVLLDDITEINSDFQAALLEFLERKTFLPVGARKAISSDVRVIAATNRDPDSAIREGLLRQDLYDRLARGGIFHVPPLRERPNDILRLAEHFVRAAAREQGFSDIFFDFSGEEQDALQSHTWPGNLRELDRVVSAAFLRACLDESTEAPLRISAPCFLQEHVLTEEKKETQNGWSGVAQRIGDIFNDSQEKKVLKRLGAIKDAVVFGLQIKAFHENEGNFSRAAGALGLAEATFIDRLVRALGLLGKRATRRDIRGMLDDGAGDFSHFSAVSGVSIEALGQMVDDVCRLQPTIPELNRLFDDLQSALVHRCVYSFGMRSLAALNAYLGCEHPKSRELVRAAGITLSRTGHMQEACCRNLRSTPWD